MPTCNYEIDYFTVTKDGTLLFDDCADSEEVEDRENTFPPLVHVPGIETLPLFLAEVLGHVVLGSEFYIYQFYTNVITQLKISPYEQIDTINQ